MDLIFILINSLHFSQKHLYIFTIEENLKTAFAFPGLLERTSATEFLKYFITPLVTPFNSTFPSQANTLHSSSWSAGAVVTGVVPWSSANNVCTGQFPGFNVAKHTTTVTIRRCLFCRFGEILGKTETNLMTQEFDATLFQCSLVNVSHSEAGKHGTIIVKTASVEDVTPVSQYMQAMDTGCGLKYFVMRATHGEEKETGRRVIYFAELKHEVVAILPLINWYSDALFSPVKTAFINKCYECK